MYIFQSLIIVILWGLFIDMMKGSSPALGPNWGISVPLMGYFVTSIIFENFDRARAILTSRRFSRSPSPIAKPQRKDNDAMAPSNNDETRGNALTLLDAVCMVSLTAILLPILCSSFGGQGVVAWSCLLAYFVNSALTFAFLYIVRSSSRGCRLSRRSSYAITTSKMGYHPAH